MSVYHTESPIRRTLLYSQRICSLAVILSAVILGTARNAQAHDMDPGTFTIVLAGREAEIVMQPYVTVFDFADDDGDNLLSHAELDAHRTEIENLIIRRVIIRDGNGLRPNVTMIESMLSDNEDASNHLQTIINMHWENAPEIVDIHYTLFPAQPDPDRDGTISWIAQDKDISLRNVVAGYFTPHENLLRLRGEGTPSPTTSRLWLAGVEHVLVGYDHILFVVALVLATASLRMLFLPLTAFTLAHTVTLAAVAFGMEPAVPSWLIEAAISISIALIVLLHFVGVRAEQIWWIAALIGLVHGLGFGQALTMSLGNLQEWSGALIGITIGVELTHLAIAIVALGGMWLVRKPHHLVLVQRAMGALIICISIYWTVERIPLW